MTEGTKTGLDQSRFDPTKYLRKLQGKEYLDVKWRVLWAHQEHPKGMKLHVEMVEHDLEKGVAVMRATVVLPDESEASDYGSETRHDFNDYIEKAATKATGRALAKLGYGTQFCEDFDFESKPDKVVDSPVAPHPTTGPKSDHGPFTDDGHSGEGQARSAPSKPTSGNGATERQLWKIRKVTEGNQEAKKKANEFCRTALGDERTLEGLSRKQASDLIEALGAFEGSTLLSAPAGRPP